MGGSRPSIFIRLCVIDGFNVHLEYSREAVNFNHLKPPHSFLSGTSHFFKPICLA